MHEWGGMSDLRLTMNLLALFIGGKNAFVYTVVKP